MASTSCCQSEQRRISSTYTCPSSATKSAVTPNSSSNESQDTQTHSAPSSPTHDDLPVPPPRIPSNQRQTSPTSRPKSMAVSSTKYAEIVLDNASKRPTPRQRTTVKYSQIVKPGQRTTSDHSTDSSSAGESAERAEEVTYDVPPSSIAARVVNPLAELPPVSVFDNNFLPPLPPKETNPFMSESENNLSAFLRSASSSSARRR